MNSSGPQITVTCRRALRHRELQYPSYSLSPVTVDLADSAVGCVSQAHFCGADQPQVEWST
jgi:hypothetical protein